MVYATAKAFFSIPLAGVRLASSIMRGTANVGLATDDFDGAAKYDVGG